MASGMVGTSDLDSRESPEETEHFSFQGLRQFVGYGFITAWVFFFFDSNVLFLTPQPHISLLDLHALSSLTTGLVPLLLIAGSSHLSPLNPRRELHFVAGLACAAGTCLISLASLDVIPGWLTTLGFVLGGTGAAWIQIAWDELFATHSTTNAALCMGIASVAGYLLYLTVSLLPQGIAVASVILLPIVSALSLRPSRSPYLAMGTVLGDAWRLFARAKPWRLIMLVFIVEFAYGALRTLSTPDSTSGLDLMGWTLGTGSLTLAVIGDVALALFAKRVKTSIAFYVAIPFIAITAISAAQMGATGNPIVFLIAYAGINLVYLMVWLLFIELVTSRGIPALIAFGCLRAAWFLGAFSGQLAGLVLIDQPLTVVFIILLLLIVAALLLSGDGSFALKGIEVPLSGQSTLATRVQSLASAHGLSPRETDVLQIWASGHQSSYIEERLHISKNTVKTHLSHIYLKTGAENREELLNLLERHA